MAFSISFSSGKEFWHKRNLGYFNMRITNQFRIPPASVHIDVFHLGTLISSLGLFEIEHSFMFIYYYRFTDTEADSLSSCLSSSRRIFSHSNCAWWQNYPACFLLENSLTICQGSLTQHWGTPSVLVFNPAGKHIETLYLTQPANVVLVPNPNQEILSPKPKNAQSETVI